MLPINSSPFCPLVNSFISVFCVVFIFYGFSCYMKKKKVDKHNSVFSGKGDDDDDEWNDPNKIYQRIINMYGKVFFFLILITMERIYAAYFHYLIINTYAYLVPCSFFNRIVPSRVIHLMNAAAKNKQQKGMNKNLTFYFFLLVWHPFFLIIFLIPLQHYGLVLFFK